MRLRAIILIDLLALCACVEPAEWPRQTGVQGGVVTDVMSFEDAHALVQVAHGSADNLMDTTSFTVKGSSRAASTIASKPLVLNSKDPLEAMAPVPEADIHYEPAFPPPGKDVSSLPASNSASKGTSPTTLDPDVADAIAQAVDDAGLKSVTDAVIRASDGYGARNARVANAAIGDQSIGSISGYDALKARIADAASGDSLQVAAQKIVAEIPTLAAGQLRKSLAAGGFTSEQLRVMTPQQMRAALEELLEERPTQELLNSLSLDAVDKTLEAADAWRQIRNQAVNAAKASSATGYVSGHEWMAQQYGM